MMTTMDLWCHRAADGGVSLVHLLCITPLAEAVFRPDLPVAARCVGGAYAVVLALTCRKAHSVLFQQDTPGREAPGR